METRPQGPSSEPEEKPLGLLESLRQLAANVLGLVETRLELISMDVAEARARIVQVAITVGVVLVCIQVGFLLILIALILAIPETTRPLTLGIAGLVLLVVALVGGLWVRHRLKKPVFAATRAEFKKDRDKLGRNP